jgi:hypothetical protein
VGARVLTDTPSLCGTRRTRHHRVCRARPPLPPIPCPVPDTRAPCPHLECGGPELLHLALQRGHLLLRLGDLGVELLRAEQRHRGRTRLVAHVCA